MPLVFAIPFMLSSCNGALISRIQALQSLSLIKAETVAHDYNSLRLVVSNSDDNIKEKNTWVYEFSYIGRICHTSFVKTNNNITSIENHEYYFLDDNIYYTYQSEYDVSTGQEEPIVTVTSDDEDVYSLFFAKYGSVYGSVLGLIETHGKIDPKISLIESFNNAESNKKVRDKYYTRGNGHIYAEIKMYSDETKKNLIRTVNFLYDQYRLQSLEDYDFIAKLGSSASVSYSAIISKPTLPL